jgi:hypothetical protein
VNGRVMLGSLRREYSSPTIAAGERVGARLAIPRRESPEQSYRISSQSAPFAGAPPASTTAGEGAFHGRKPVQKNDRGEDEYISEKLEKGGRKKVAHATPQRNPISLAEVRVRRTGEKRIGKGDQSWSRSAPATKDFRMNRRFFAAVALLSLLISPTAMAQEADVTAVAVRVETKDGRSIENAYAALLPPWRPSTRPVVETVGNDRIVLWAPAGSYWVMAGARGYAMSLKGPFTVSTESGATVSVTLEPLASTSGRVLDARGGPVAGARVASMNAAIPAPLGTVSEVAARHLSSDWSTTTDRDGRWTLDLPAGDVPLLFEAPGLASEWRIRPKGDHGPLDVVLSEGATLNVETERIEPNLVVTLARDADGPGSIPVSDQAAVWSRWATRTDLMWSSLPPGTYSIYAEYPDPLFFMSRPVRVATVTLAPGETADVRVELPPARRKATAYGTLFLRGMRGSDRWDDLELFARDAGGKPERLQHAVEEALGGTVAYVKTEGVRGPFYGMTKDRFFFTAPDVVDAGAGASGAPAVLVVRPRAEAHLRLRYADEDLEPSRSGVAALLECGSDERTRVSVPIRIDKNSVAAFSAPAGCRTAILKFDPFEPVIITTALAPGSQSLGEFVLKVAASAEVHVVRDPGALPVEGALVRVFSDRTAPEQPIPVAEATSDEGGWAKIHGLPPNRTVRIIGQTAEGDRSDPVVISLEPRRQAVIDPLTIREPATVIVDAKIDEDVLSRFPAARVATLLITPADVSRNAEKRQENVGPEGMPIRFERLHPGIWRISGVVSLAGVFTVQDLEEIKLKAGETAIVEATIAPNVFQGLVTSKGAGVAAKVIVEDGTRKLNFTSDPDGSFRLALQKPGTYRVWVARLSAQGNMIPVGEVEFRDPLSAVNIRIPDGGGATARVRRAGRPVAGAVVWVSRREGSGTVERATNRAQTSDATGEAKFEDLIPGAWTFTVTETETHRAAEKTVNVEAGANVAFDLDLSSAATISGTIRSFYGAPLPDADVECLFLGLSGNPDRVSTRSDSKGEFAFEMSPPGPPAALCSVIGPMGVVDAFRSTLGQHANVTLPVLTATLTIADWAEERAPELYWLVAPDGRTISLSTSAGRLGAAGLPLTIPGLAAGSWKVVRVESLPLWVALASGAGGSLSAVTTVTLEPGSAKTIFLGNTTAHDFRGPLSTVD